MNVLVTGGAGYIGSHAVRRLLADGHRVTVVDDLSRGHRGAIDRLSPLGDLTFVESDLGDVECVRDVLTGQGVQLVMHFGALAYVGESVTEPLRYYRNNVASTLGLLQAMTQANVSRLVFSSTCATYGEPSPERIPIREDCPQAPANPYGRTKLAVEWMVRDHAHAQRIDGKTFSFAFLRYFNVAGADQTGVVGEDHDPETHLIPICLEVASGEREAITIFGTDYATPDGTCVRDYVHVDDLIDAHVKMMDTLGDDTERIYNVGIGKGYSVREVVDACRSVTGQKIPEREGARREGDPPTLCCDGTKILTEIGWTPGASDLETIIETAWRWKRENPDGYGSVEVASRS